MRKNLLLFTCFALGMLGMNTGVWGQTTQVFNLDSRIPDPALSITTNPTSLTPKNLFNETVPLVASGAGGEGTLTYQWSPAQGLSDATIANPTLTFDNGFRPLSYTVVVTDELGCQDSASISVDYSVARLEATTLPISMSIQPNPSNGYFHISLNGEPLAGELNIAIMDQVGRRVYDQEAGRFTGRLEQDIDLSDLSNGVYFIGLESQGRTAFSKIIIQ